ncbi:MAG: LCP family protein [Candidatus Woesearchaeota archaeon]|nr:LCP family protein [Candidatus Woesearchaeota archaeon]
MKKFTRRDFLKLAGLAAAGTALANAKPIYQYFNPPKKISYADMSGTGTQPSGSSQIPAQGAPSSQNNAVPLDLPDSIVKIEDIVSGIRTNRIAEDNDYLPRMTPELFDKYVANFLFIGKSSTISPPDAYKILSLTRDGQVDITSIHRDLYVPELDRRVNFAWYKGFSTTNILVPIIENITGLPIDFYFFTNTERLIQELIDIASDREGILIKVQYACGPRYPGEEVMMSGETAMRYARERKCDSDDTRMVRQQEVIQGLVDRIQYDFENEPFEEVKRAAKMYNLVKKYESYGQVQFGYLDRSAEGVDQSILLAEMFIQDKLVNGVPLPQLNKQINLGVDIPLYLSWPAKGERHWYQNITEDIFRIWYPGDIKHNEQWESLEGHGIDMQYLRDNYYQRVRDEVKNLLLE